MIQTVRNAKANFSYWQLIGLLVVLLLVVQVSVPFLLPRASAGSLGKTIVRFDRMNTSQATTGMVCAAASASGAGTEASVKVTFPTGYTVSGTAGNWTVTSTTTGWPSGAATWPGIGTATSVSGQSVTFPSNDITDTTLHCFNWSNTAALSIKSSATANNTGTVITQATGPTTIDTGNYATSSVASTCGTGSQGCDQIYVSASVNSTFSFSLLSNTASLGTLSASGPTSATAINARVDTNAEHGWQMWAADPASGGQTGLYSTTAAHQIAYSPTVGSASAALTTGAEGYNLGAGTAGTGTCTSVTDDTNFASGGTAFKGGGLDNTLRSLAVSTGVANDCELPLTVNASISATTPPATDYAGTVTVVAAGSF